MFNNENYYSPVPLLENEAKNPFALFSPILRRAREGPSCILFVARPAGHLVISKFQLSSNKQFRAEFSTAGSTAILYTCRISQFSDSLPYSVLLILGLLPSLQGLHIPYACSS